MRSASSVHVRHASVEVNVVIGVVLGELHVVRVVPLVVCDDAAVRRTLVLIALCRCHCFRRSHFASDFAVLEVYQLHPSSVTVNCVGCHRILNCSDAPSEF